MGGSSLNAPYTLVRILLWLGSLVIAVCLFSLLLSRGESDGSVVFMFRVTMIFALPVWLLYLPLVVLLKDAEGRRWWVLLVSGAFIGPLCLFLWGLILQLRGENAHVVWQGDGEAPGIAGLMVFASIVGFLTTGLYAVGLKLFSRKIL
jgi:hypothetical protein